MIQFSLRERCEVLQCVADRRCFRDHKYKGPTRGDNSVIRKEIMVTGVSPIGI